MAHLPFKLPRGYLSWTQFDLANKSEDEYVRTYIHDGKRHVNKEMEFGKSFASILEGIEDTEDDIVSMVKSMIQKRANPEVDMEAMLRAKGRELKLIGKLDSYDGLPGCAFDEYKTGKGKWTQEKAQKHGQLLFYKAMIWINHRVNPESRLIWVQTEDFHDDKRLDEGEIVLTGQVMPFTVLHTDAEILSMMGKIFKTAERIEYLYQREMDAVFA